MAPRTCTRWPIPWPRISSASRTLRAFPVEQFLYWAKGGVGAEPSITLHHLVIQREPGGSIYIADKQLYASRYIDAGLLVLWLATPPDGQGYYLLAGMRARSSLLEGLTARHAPGAHRAGIARVRADLPGLAPQEPRAEMTVIVDGSMGSAATWSRSPARSGWWWRER